MSTLAGFSAEQTSSLTNLISDAINKTLQEHFSPRQSITQPVTQSIAPPATQSTSHQKKRNQKTRQQYKKKAQAQRVTSQEVEHTLSEKPSKHVVLQSVKSVAWERLAVIHCWHAVIQWNKMTMKDGMIMVDCATMGMPRIGIGWSILARQLRGFTYKHGPASHTLSCTSNSSHGGMAFFLLCGHVVTVCQGLVPD